MGRDRATAAATVKGWPTAGMADANVYDPVDTSVGGTHAFFLVRGDARSYNLPPKPESPTSLLGAAWTSAAKASGAIAVASLVAFALFGREGGVRPRSRARRKGHGGKS